MKLRTLRRLPLLALFAALVGLGLASLTFTPSAHAAVDDVGDGYTCDTVHDDLPNAWVVENDECCGSVGHGVTSVVESDPCCDVIVIDLDGAGGGDSSCAEDCEWPNPDGLPKFTPPENSCLVDCPSVAGGIVLQVPIGEECDINCDLLDPGQLPPPNCDDDPGCNDFVEDCAPECPVIDDNGNVEIDNPDCPGPCDGQPGGICPIPEVCDLVANNDVPDCPNDPDCIDGDRYDCLDDDACVIPAAAGCDDGEPDLCAIAGIGCPVDDLCAIAGIGCPDPDPDPDPDPCNLIRCPDSTPPAVPGTVCYTIDDGDDAQHLVQLDLDTGTVITSHQILDAGEIESIAYNNDTGEIWAYDWASDPNTMWVFTYDDAGNLISTPQPWTIEAWVATFAADDVDALFWVNDTDGDPANDQLWMVVDSLDENGVVPPFGWLVQVDPADGSLVTLPVQIQLPATGEAWSIEAATWVPATGEFLIAYYDTANPDGPTYLATIDPATGEITSSVTTVSAVEGMGTDGEGAVYIATGEEGPDANTLYIVDVSTGEAGSLIDLQAIAGEVDYESLDCTIVSAAAPDPAQVDPVRIKAQLAPDDDAEVRVGPHAKRRAVVAGPIKAFARAG